MSSSEIDVNGEIDLNLNVTGKGGGQIAVIVIGVLVAVICIMLILYFSCRNGCKCCDNLCCKGRCHHNQQKAKQKEADVDGLKRHIEDLQRHIGRLEYQVQTTQPALEYPLAGSGFHQFQSPMSSAVYAGQNLQGFQNFNHPQSQMQMPQNAQNAYSRTSSPAAGSENYLIQTQPKNSKKKSSKSKDSKKKSSTHQNNRIVELPSSNLTSYPPPTVNIRMEPDRFVEV